MGEGENEENSEKLTVDHINEFKLDNRRENLRSATQSEQNANRKARSDKLPPPSELIEAGVTELPKYVRWDNSEKKFVIEKHPALLAQELKKPYMSGTKSRKLTVLQKYQDILHKLDELNTQLPDDYLVFKSNKHKLANEYLTVTNIIRAMYNKEPLPLIDKNPVQPIVPSSKTVKGRRSVLVLPEGCGVNIEDVPKHCYYRKGNDKRGDCFIIERHPGLPVAKRTWQTTSSKDVTTKQKFDLMMEMYETLKLN